MAIQASALGKRYRIGAVKSRNDRFGEQLFDLLMTPARRASSLLRGRSQSAADLSEELWALRDVSFSINQGEVVGVIGRNGAGKSTLLKILSRITEPTEGFADLYGRVGSLLEVGTGFHPELTGRENIFLNGSILGMTKGEIVSRLDEIVAFAEIEEFIDTPVKHYSSGMYVRLAFSVAAHLEPDILLVDEVLAVGDVAFQRKCLGRMDDVAKQGRTVLFVSHNMALIQSLCNRGILVSAGHIVSDGPVSETVDRYLQSLENTDEIDLSQRRDRRGQGRTRLVGLDVCGEDGRLDSPIRTGRRARFIFSITGKTSSIACVFAIYDHLGLPVTTFRSDAQSKTSADSNDQLRFACDIDQMLLLPGRYRVAVSIIGDNVVQDFLEAATYFNVSEGLLNGQAPYAGKGNRFRVAIPHRWEMLIS